MNAPFTPHKRTFRQRFYRRQHGYMLLSLMLALPIITGIGVWVISEQVRAAQLGRNVAEGSQAAQFAVGLRGYMAVVQQDPLANPTTRTGVDWLKSPTCGGMAGNPAEGFVSCTYTGGSFGHLYQTTFTKDVTTNLIEARASFVVPPLNGDPKSAILSAEQIVQSALANQSVPANGIFFTAFANTAVSANTPVVPSSIADANRGRVLMVATNAPSNDLWLRTDGTNIMQANLNMGDHSLENVMSARFQGDVRVDNVMHVDNGITTSEMYISSINKFATEGVYYAETFSGPTQVPKPNCSAASGNPAIYVAIQSLGQLPDADTVFWTGSVDVDSNWNTMPRIQGVKFDLAWDGSIYTLERQRITRDSPPGFRYVVMTRCR